MLTAGWREWSATSGDGQQERDGKRNKEVANGTEFSTVHGKDLCQTRAGKA